MKAASLPANEVDRLSALRAYEILDTLYEAQFDALTRLAASICNVPISLVSLVDKDRQWFKSVVGLAEGVRETPREVAFCAHAIHGTELFEISDAHDDVRFSDNPLVTGSPHVRYYAGVPLIDSQGYALGTLCVIDHAPRSLSMEQKAALAELAELAVALMEGRKLSLQAQKAQKALSAEVEMAQHYMDRLLRSGGLDRPGVQHLILPAGSFSGDVIGATVTPDGKFMGILADVTGHGLGSALYSIPMMEAFYNMAAKGCSLAVICRELNSKLKRMLPPGHFVAAALVSIDEKRGEIAVWNGGAPPAIVADDAGNIVGQSTSRHVALGIHADGTFDDAVEIIGYSNPCELLMYSDGLPEAENQDREAFGDERIRCALRAGARSASHFDRTVAALRTFLGTTLPHDDISILGVQIGRSGHPQSSG